MLVDTTIKHLHMKKLCRSLATFCLPHAGDGTLHAFKNLPNAVSSHETAQRVECVTRYGNAKRRELKRIGNGHVDAISMSFSFQ